MKKGVNKIDNHRKYWHKMIYNAQMADLGEKVDQLRLSIWN